ncbi:MAG: prolipoprotein diacylglyceryl transferase [Bdellovibrionales bacterium]|nr:prolipoprotein diacylglyceryl transferase [Bdellovibrionales bacterium]
MHPILFEINFGSFSFPLHSYGLMIALGFLSGIYTVRKLAARGGVNPDLVADLAFWLLMWGFVGARMLYIITRWSEFMASPMDMFKVWEGGLVFFGGLISATAFAVYFFKKHDLPAWKMSDILAPGVVVAHAFGRVGCFAAGCCYGRPTDEPWGMKFNSELVDASLRGIPLHPVQLYESVSLFILFAGLIYLFKHKKFDGQVSITYFMIYPIIRSIVEMFRGDVIRGFVIQDVLSTSQFISIFVFLGTLYLFIKRAKQVKA